MMLKMAKHEKFKFSRNRFLSSHAAEIFSRHD